MGWERCIEAIRQQNEQIARLREVLEIASNHVREPMANDIRAILKETA